MNRTDVILGDELQVLKDEAIEQVFEAVTGTMGPDGNFGILDHGLKPKATKDGVSVAKAIKFSNPVKDLIAQIITEAAIKTDQECGDGTTTTTFLTYHFYDMFKDLLNSKGSFVVKTKLNKYLKETLAFIDEQTREVDVNDPIIESMALTTANGEKRLVDTVLNIFKQIGDNALIDLRKGNDGKDIVEYFKGVRFDGGYANPSFSIGGSGTTAKYQEVNGVVFDGSFKTTDVNTLGKFTQLAIEQLKGVVVLVAREFSNDWLSLFSGLNQANKGFTIMPVTIRASGTAGAGVVGDLALCLNGEADNVFVSPEAWIDHGLLTRKWKDVVIGLSRIEFGLEDLDRKLIDQRIEQIRLQIQEMTPDRRNSPTASLLNRRIANLSGAQVTIVVGGETESDIIERFDRYEDVSRAITSALKAGVLPGMGSVLAKAGQMILAEHGDDLIAKCFAQVLTQQVEFLLGEEYNNNTQFVNLATGETASSPDQLGIWDAKLATVTALKAGLATALILGSNHCVVLGYRSGAVTG